MMGVQNDMGGGGGGEGIVERVCRHDSRSRIGQDEIDGRQHVTEM